MAHKESTNTQTHVIREIARDRERERMRVCMPERKISPFTFPIISFHFWSFPFNSIQKKNNENQLNHIVSARCKLKKKTDNNIKPNQIK